MEHFLISRPAISSFYAARAFLRAFRFTQLLKTIFKIILKKPLLQLNCKQHFFCFHGNCIEYTTDINPRSASVLLLPIEPVKRICRAAMCNWAQTWLYKFFLQLLQQSRKYNLQHAQYDFLWSLKGNDEAASVVASATAVASNPSRKRSQALALKGGRATPSSSTMAATSASNGNEDKILIEMKDSTA